MRSAELRPIRLEDYTPFPYLLPTLDMVVRIGSDSTEVETTLGLAPAARAAADGCLHLHAVAMEVEALLLDGVPLDARRWNHADGVLTVRDVPADPFRLTSRCRLDPSSNTSLEGLYVSGGMFTTQCEAEGFRRITPHPDRPDLLSRFTVRIEAPRALAPVLLSNGNCIDRGELDRARHYSVWQDPFPKPSYLFALVAGRLVAREDLFTTCSGREVRLRIFVEPGDEAYTGHAMASLRRSMAWDEQRFKLEYDLDEYNIVAVRHFNMGAMENKSLNIFNAKLILADVETATDGDLERIESVIAHEYFHNWTGNRITCRDWFQLSLKEGLTVYRDQEFSADLHSRAVKRIADVAMLRSTQFREDAGPTAHPVQPDGYVAIDNFYTTTIYEKGAELIRMLQILLGRERFDRGIALYVERHDGSAATCEDFLRAMEDAAETDLLPFRRWYHQAGTPQLTVAGHWDPVHASYRLDVSQHTAPTPGQDHKVALVIPLAMALLDGRGQALPLALAGEPASAEASELPRERVLLCSESSQSFTFTDLAAAPVPSLLRGFSAPVKLEEITASRAGDLLRFAADSDGFARWDAGQRLLLELLLGRAEDKADPGLLAEITSAFGAILADLAIDNDYRCCLLSLPRQPILEDAASEPDPIGLADARRNLMGHFGAALAEPLLACMARVQPELELAWPQGSGARGLEGVGLAWRCASADGHARRRALALVSSASMTRARAGLAALQPWDCQEREEALDRFYARWQERPVILDTWFSLQAATPFGDTAGRVRELLNHPRFDLDAPNSIRAVLGGFAGSPHGFHAVDGSGYALMAELTLLVDQRNPITASRLAKAFSRWQSYGPKRAQAMRSALEGVAEADLSSNTREVVQQCLGKG